MISSQGKNVDGNQYQNCFTDVKDEWFAPYICYAKEKEWVDGYPDGSFKPAKFVNKAEAIKMLLETYSIFDYLKDDDVIYKDVDKNTWFGPYIYSARRIGILPVEGDYYYPNQEMSRAEITETLYRLLIELKAYIMDVENALK